MTKPRQYPYYQLTVDDEATTSVELQTLVDSLNERGITWLLKRFESRDVHTTILNFDYERQQPRVQLHIEPYDPALTEDQIIEDLQNCVKERIEEAAKAISARMKQAKWNAMGLDDSALHLALIDAGSFELMRAGMHMFCNVGDFLRAYMYRQKRTDAEVSHG